jgi:UV DNA damage endonuclease
MRLGFPVKVLGQPGLKSHDSRRWQNDPHLSVSLAYLRDIFVYLARQGIHMYRMASDLAPYAAHPEMPGFHGQIDECARELAIVGDMASKKGLRLSFHVSPSTVLNASKDSIASQSAEQIAVQARILGSMGQGREAVVVTHVGGVYGDKEASLARFIDRYERLPDFVRQRLAVENDDTRFSVADIARIHQETTVPLVFDYLHFRKYQRQCTRSHLVCSADRAECRASRQSPRSR